MLAASPVAGRTAFFLDLLDESVICSVVVVDDGAGMFWLAFLVPTWTTWVTGSTKTTRLISFPVPSLVILARPSTPWSLFSPFPQARLHLPNAEFQTECLPLQ